MGEEHGIRAMSDDKLWRAHRMAIMRNCPAVVNAICSEWRRRMELDASAQRKEVIKMRLVV